MHFGFVLLYISINVGDWTDTIVCVCISSVGSVVMIWNAAFWCKTLSMHCNVIHSPVCHCVRAMALVMAMLWP